MITMPVLQSIEDQTKIAAQRITSRNCHNLPQKSMTLTIFNVHYIGVMHIVDMYESKPKSSIIIAMKDNP
jgi:hypothetical protein